MAVKVDGGALIDVIINKRKIVGIFSSQLENAQETH